MYIKLYREAYIYKFISIMKITITAKTGKKESKIEKLSDYHFIVWTKMPAKENKANEDIIRQLADYFKVSKSSIYLILGRTMKEKVFEIGIK